MKDILYFMHIPWQWIKQRPHFLAENLQTYYDVDVFYLKGFNKKTFTNAKNPKFVKSIFRLPLMKSKISKIFNPYLIKAQMKSKMRSYKYLWLTDPILYDYIKDIIPENMIVIYDCMDDHLQFSEIKESNYKYNHIYSLEINIIKRADYVFISSMYLKDKLIKRYGDFNGNIINNGIKSLPTSTANLNLHDNYKINKDMKIVTYIGTISEWFDFPLLMKSLELNQNIVYLLVGPSDQAIPEHNRIIAIGPVDHEKIFPIMSGSDCLIMPFVLNELILSVDPVKVYEYIYSCTPTIVVKYGETLKFKDFVYLYTDINEYMDYIDMLTNNNLNLKKDKDKHIVYINENTWKNRVENIKLILKAANS